MVNIENYISSLTQLLKAEFGARLIYVGLQGSYLRGEANENSDIDIMAVIDGLGLSDLEDYRGIIEGLGDFDKSCGFICSKEDLMRWNPMEICHLLHTTKDYFGVLSALVPAYTQEDVRNFVKMSVNNLYHELCHRYVHGSDENIQEALPFCYKGVFFILQNLKYLRTGEFIGTKAAMLEKLSGKDHMVMERALMLNRGVPFDFADSFELLFTWCQETMKQL